VLRSTRIVLALLGFVSAVFGVGLLVSAVFDTHRTSRILDAVAALGILGVSFLLYRSLGWRGDAAARSS
jgi:Na+/melibiose symporter-like transporter